jgi:carbon storage regulator CsrA
MLVLTRKIGEKVIVKVPGMESLIEVQIVNVRGNGVTKIGFKADPEVRIAREEVYEAMEAGKWK